MYNVHDIFSWTMLHSSPEIKRAGDIINMWLARCAYYGIILFRTDESFTMKPAWQAWKRRSSTVTTWHITKGTMKGQRDFMMMIPLFSFSFLFSPSSLSLTSGPLQRPFPAPSFPSSTLSSVPSSPPLTV